MTNDEKHNVYVGSYVMSALDWCGCGRPYLMDAAMLAYLKALDADDLKSLLQDHPEFEVYVVSYIADELEWVEHGTALPYAWLTKKDRHALECLSAEVTEDDFDDET